MAPGDLQEVLAVLRPGGTPPPADLLVGLGAADDAAVYRVAPDLAIVETVDFFPPVVDDPYTWGAVAAANAMSDVYAMGGQVMFALAVAGFPRELPKAIIAEVFRGGAEKVAEAGGVIAGGHTVIDAEPKYGLCVTGRVHPDRILIKGGLRPGALALAGAGNFGGGMKRNRRYVEAVFGSRLALAADIAPALTGLLFESETSGGLLFSVAPDRASRVTEGFARRGEPCWEVGEVVPQPVIRVSR